MFERGELCARVTRDFEGESDSFELFAGGPV